MDYVSKAFERERIRRAIARCDDNEELRAICATLIEANNHLRAMLVEKIEQEMPNLDSTGL